MTDEVDWNLPYVDTNKLAKERTTGSDSALNDLLSAIGFKDVEIFLIQEICNKDGLTHMGLFRQALRLYQFENKHVNKKDYDNMMSSAMANEF